MATQIDILGITKLTLGAHLHYHKLVSNKIESYEATSLHLVALAPLYAAAVAAEKAVMNRPTSFAATSQMVTVNNERNKTVSQAFNLVSTFLKSVLATEVASAQRLHAIMAPHKGIQDHEYYRKTTEIDRLHSTLKSASPTDISTLALGTTIEQMGIKNEAFKELMRERSRDVAVRMPIIITDSRKLRHTTDEIYQKIATTINSFAIAMPSPELESFTKSINALIVQFKHVIANQGPKGALRGTKDALREANVFDDKL